MTTRVLILCTHNSARSVLGETMLNHLAAKLGKDVRAFSAGSSPRGQVNPFALKVLDAAGLDTSYVRSKSWDEFAAPTAPHMHFVITVCDQAAGEVCPMWPGQPMTAHWGFADPVAVEGSDEAKLKAFHQAMYQISNRISIFLSLPMDKLDRLALQEKVRDIGKMDPSVEMPDFLKKD